MTFTMGEGRLEVTVTVSQFGDDLCVTATGGAAHVGAVALGIPGKTPDAAVSVLTAEGHKEDIPAKLLSQEIAAGTGRRTAVVCGIHYDDITREEIDCVMRLVRDAGERIVTAWGK
jgi:hypothetical protein